MPTGYTADIAKGISFEEYALGCARAFGALILMRDEPADTPIPDKFEASSHHADALVKAKNELAELNSATPEQLTELAQKYYDDQLASYENSLSGYTKLEEKYNAMLGKARDYVAPSPDHTGFKDFMISQIEESIKWDCNASYLTAPVLLNGLEYYALQLNKIEWDVNYHTKALAEEIERTNSRNEWVKKLKESLSIPESIAI